MPLRFALAPDGRQWPVPQPVFPAGPLTFGDGLSWGGEPVGWGISTTLPVPAAWGGEPITWGEEPVTWGRA